MAKLFFNAKNRSVYNGTQVSASFIREASPLVSEAESRNIDKENAQIRALEKSDNFYKFTLTQ